MIKPIDAYSICDKLKNIASEEILQKILDAPPINVPLFEYESTKIKAMDIIENLKDEMIRKRFIDNIPEEDIRAILAISTIIAKIDFEKEDETEVEDNIENQEQKVQEEISEELEPEEQIEDEVSEEEPDSEEQEEFDNEKEISEEESNIEE